MVIFSRDIITFTTDDLLIDITANTATAAELLLLQDDWEAFNHNSNLPAIDQTDLNQAVTDIETAMTGVNGSVFATTGGVDIVGAESTSVSDNTINLGSGDDVVVLGTDDTSNDTLVFTGTDIGTNAIYNYDDDTANGSDILDTWGHYI